MAEFRDLSPEELSILANIVAIGLTKNRTADEINVFGNLVTAIGSLLLTIAAQKQSLSSLEDQSNQTQQSGKKSK